MAKRRAIFLDRDGTLNYDAGYTHKIADWHWKPDAIEALAKFQNNGWLLVVVSNQSGIGRGYYTLKQVKQLEAYIDAQLAQKNVQIAAWRYCPHLPEANCLCRKPKPGLILKAARQLNINLSRSWMIGDRLCDAEAGNAAGCQIGLVENQRFKVEQETAKVKWPQIHIWPGLMEAACEIAPEIPIPTRSVSKNFTLCLL